MKIRAWMRGFAGLLWWAAASAWADDGNAPQAAAPAVQALPYAGMDRAPGAWLGFGGVVASLTGNLAQPGWVLRAFAAYGEYENDNFTALVGRARGHVTMREMEVGYQALGDTWRMAGYAGLERQDIHTFLPDLGGATGDLGKTGVKVFGEFETRATTPFYFNALASYSKAFDSWWVRVRPGYQSKAVTLGPEMTFQGNQSGHSRRLGGFATVLYPLGSAAYVGASAAAGYLWTQGDLLSTTNGTRNGVYGNLTVFFLF